MGGIEDGRLIEEAGDQSFDRRSFVSALQRLVPEIPSEDLVPGGAGVRAQAVLPSGDFVHDVLWVESPGAVHAVNAPSPAPIASLEIGAEIARRATAQLT